MNMKKIAFVHEQTQYGKRVLGGRNLMLSVIVLLGCSTSAGAGAVYIYACVRKLMGKCCINIAVLSLVLGTAAGTLFYALCIAGQDTVVRFMLVGRLCLCHICTVGGTDLRSFCECVSNGLLLLTDESVYLSGRRLSGA